MTDRDAPDFRATIRRDGLVRLLDWGPWMPAGGPLYTLLEARGRAGVAIADLTVVRGEDAEEDGPLAVEVIVDFRCGGASGHRTALTDWAARVGYRRVWFDDEVTDLDPAPGGPVETRCTGCRARLADAEPEFWEYVRRRGAFPSVCMLCGADVPQWIVPRTARAAAGGRRPPARTARSRVVR